jgi:hypothetical protein
MGVQPEEVKVVRDFHPAVEFLFGHDLAEWSIPCTILNRMFVPGLGYIIQLIRMFVANEYLMGRVIYGFLITPQMTLYLF